MKQTFKVHRQWVYEILAMHRPALTCLDPWRAPAGREAELGGSGGMLPRKFFNLSMQFGAFWCILEHLLGKILGKKYMPKGVTKIDKLKQNMILQQVAVEGLGLSIISLL